MPPHYWKVLLLDHDHADQGDVATQYGEFVGTWSIDEQGWYTFVADGDHEPSVVGVGVGHFCYMIADRLEAKPASTFLVME